MVNYEIVVRDDGSTIKPETFLARIFHIRSAGSRASPFGVKRVRR